MGKGRNKKPGCLRAFLAVAGGLCLIIVTVFCVFVSIGVKEGIEEAKAIPYQKVEIGQEELSGKYYYEQLDTEQKKTVYTEIKQGIMDHTEEIYVHSGDADETNVIFQYVLKDCPEIFWCEGSSRTTAYESEENYTVLKPDYAYGTEEREARQGQIDAAANECLAGIAAEASEYEKILYVYEYIVNTVDYDLSAPDNQNICSVFINKSSVCAGYSRATQYLLERMGVFCTYVTGVTETQNHAWNLVMCGGDYYYVDTTWGDPVFQAAENESDLSRNYIGYDYMCCSDEELMKTHTPDGDVALPPCTSMECNYYVVNGMYYTEYDSEMVLQTMNNIISAKGNPVVLKFASNDLYNQAHSDIFNNLIERAAQNLADLYGMNEVQYQYIDEPELNKITVYWEY